MALIRFRSGWPRFLSKRSAPAPSRSTSLSRLERHSEEAWFEDQSGKELLFIQLGQLCNCQLCNGPLHFLFLGSTTSANEIGFPRCTLRLYRIACRAEGACRFIPASRLPFRKPRTHRPLLGVRPIHRRTPAAEQLGESGYRAPIAGPPARISRSYRLVAAESLANAGLLSRLCA